jgi:hypothetical protein
MIMKEWLDDLEDGMRYPMTYPLRWSKKYQLVKRGYTFDKWVFYAIATNDVVEALPVTRAGNYISGQSVRSCHSPAFNYGAQGAG